MLKCPYRSLVKNKCIWKKNCIPRSQHSVRFTNIRELCVSRPWALRNCQNPWDSREIRESWRLCGDAPLFQHFREASIFQLLLNIYIQLWYSVAFMLIDNVIVDSLIFLSTSDVSALLNVRNISHIFYCNELAGPKCFHTFVAWALTQRHTEWGILCRSPQMIHWSFLHYWATLSVSKAICSRRSRK